MAVAALTVATTITGGNAFGITWRNKIRSSVIPIARDASMNGRGLIVRTTERITAATRGVNAIDTAMMTDSSDDPRAATRAKASRKPGKASRMSITTSVMRSIQ